MLPKEIVIVLNLTNPLAWLYVETCPPVIWMSKTQFEWVEISLDGWWMGKKLVEKKVFKDHIYVQLFLENGCQFISGHRTHLDRLVYMLVPTKNLRATI